jgi:sugar diacid utilization regulator
MPSTRSIHLATEGAATSDVGWADTVRPRAGSPCNQTLMPTGFGRPHSEPTMRCRSEGSAAPAALLDSLLKAETTDLGVIASAATELPVRIAVVSGASPEDSTLVVSCIVAELTRSVAVCQAQQGTVAAVLLRSRDGSRSPVATIRAVVRGAERTHRPCAGIRVGLGGGADRTDVWKSWDEAMVALRFAAATQGATTCDPADAVVDYDELGALHLLAHLPSSRLRSQPDVVRLNEIAETPSGAMDVVALEAFCRTGSLRQAAQMLYMHHSTVAVRLARLEATTGWDLNDVDDRFRARIALWARRLACTSTTS